MTDRLTIETYAPGTDTPELLGTETMEVPISGRDMDRRSIVTQWHSRRQAVAAAHAAIADARNGIVTATAAVQRATTTTDVVAAVKAQAAANLVALGALEQHSIATAYALGILERAVIWLDAELADMGDQTSPDSEG